MAGFWSSFNRPYFPELFVSMGYSEYQPRSNIFSFDNNPRVGIFRREQSSVCQLLLLSDLFVFSLLLFSSICFGFFRIIICISFVSSHKWFLIFSLFVSVCLFVVCVCRRLILSPQCRKWLDTITGRLVRFFHISLVVRKTLVYVTLFSHSCCLCPCLFMYLFVCFPLIDIHLSVFSDPLSLGNAGNTIAARFDLVPPGPQPISWLLRGTHGTTDGKVLKLLLFVVYVVCIAVTCLFRCAL